MSAANDKALRMSYRIGRGEQGVLTFEPYKSKLLPLWRFRTVPLAKKSCEELWECFEEYRELGDFVGMDMTRKFIQMGMTRAMRYANHAGGRKYSKATGKELDKSSTHKDAGDKLAASNVFRETWNRCRSHEGYLRLKNEFQYEQKEWDKEKKAFQRAKEPRPSGHESPNANSG
ncbi:MAG: hypothetical protein M1835_005036 [Candelina submexicana]|nr:MAG: hypothetical protein M1835_005036 [Candelina submexicana]